MSRFKLIVILFSEKDATNIGHTFKKYSWEITKNEIGKNVPEEKNKHQTNCEYSFEKIEHKKDAKKRKELMK